MKKVIFLAIAAAAALTACSKSEVIDSKYGNDMIGFETYLGRDAQTKANPIEREDLTSVKIFGYYHGTSTWAEGKSLLWTDGLTLTTTSDAVSQPTGADVRYWANDSDLYSFLAYAPVEGLVEGEGFDANDPTLTYTVNNEFTNGDVLVAEPQIDRTQDDGTVSLQLKHKLSRLTVDAEVVAGVFEFRVKEITLTGAFNTTGTISLADPTTWTATPTASTSYTFHNADDAEVALESGQISDKGYLMLIPVTAEEHQATLTVKYTTYDPNAKQESSTYSQTYNVTNDFAMGTAYAIKLKFENDAKTIVFDVEVDPTWQNGEATITPAA